MSEFTTAAQNMLVELENGLRGPFSIQRNYEFDGHKYASHAIYGNNDPRKMMFIKAIQRAQNSFEFVYMDVCRTLSEEKLNFYFDTLWKMTREIVPWDLETHMYTNLTMLVLTEGEPEKKLIKQLKKFRCYRECMPNEEGNGWSVARLCLIDVQTGKIYCNAQGKPAAERAKPAVKKALTR
jgi:hypothetical protein